MCKNKIQDLTLFKDFFVSIYLFTTQRERETDTDPLSTSSLYKTVITH